MRQLAHQNGNFGFAMLHYTEALKLDLRLAGIAVSVSVFWKAITEPVMGHFSGRTLQISGILAARRISMHAVTVQATGAVLSYLPAELNLRWPPPAQPQPDSHPGRADAQLQEFPGWFKSAPAGREFRTGMLFNKKVNNRRAGSSGLLGIETARRSGLLMKS